jgi:hypothetical protein
MLGIEEIKKACEFADGFDIVNDTKDRFRIFLDKKLVLLGDLGFSYPSYYSLFLQRVIEGINEGTDYFIYGDDKMLLCGIKNKRVPLMPCYYRDQSIDQAKEQAIKYILDQL